MELVSCNLCGSKEADLVYQLADWSFNDTDSHYDYVRCRSCGLIYQNPRPTSEEMGKFYPDDYDCYSVKTRAQRTPFSLLDKAINYGMIKRVSYVTRHQKHGELLDVGCATGVFLDFFRDYFHSEKQGEWSFQGVETSSYASELARKKGLKVFTGQLKDAHFPDESFDAVTLWDVFEHLHNPKADLCEIRRILKNDGILVMRLPNLDSWDAKIFGKYWAGFEPPRHLYVFGTDTISRMVKDNGFEILELDAKSSKYLTFVLSFHFFLTGIGVSLKTRDLISRVLNHPFCRLLFAPVFFFYGAGLRGPLLTIVVRKI